ncbi:hypothetical protein PHJA_002495500 [Phtheirospermum japonicum]|uniref:Uncharacterized protein n=1 Tax=Phtheirospermum japonicum TaxID=374723 RepID=A0A830CWD4_9LAMI|nr:hypothetical protein PHJA_002495500 [Phtheirospermum japonicum]
MWRSNTLLIHQDYWLLHFYPLYSEAFEGVVLAYDPVISNESAKIIPGILPYVGVKLKAQLLFFGPKPDMLLAANAKYLPTNICLDFIV